MRPSTTSSAADFVATTTGTNDQTEVELINSIRVASPRPRPSDRTDIDMVSQRAIRLEERKLIREAQNAAVADFHNFIVKQRGFQLKACHGLLEECRRFQARKRESPCRPHKSADLARLPQPREFRDPKTRRNFLPFGSTTSTMTLNY